MEERIEIEDHLRSLLGESAGLEPAEIPLDAPLLRGGLELDSLTITQFVLAVEDAYQVHLLEEDLNLSWAESLSALAGLIVEKTGS